MYSLFQFQMNKRETLICEFEMKFKKSFCWRSNLSNDGIFSDGLKWVRILETVSETGVENDIFGLKVGQDLKNLAAHPQKEFSGVPSPLWPLTFIQNDIYSLKALVVVTPINFGLLCAVQGLKP